jgi:hypothetical protein
LRFRAAAPPQAGHLFESDLLVPPASSNACVPNESQSPACRGGWEVACDVLLAFRRFHAGLHFMVLRATFLVAAAFLTGAFVLFPVVFFAGIFFAALFLACDFFDEAALDALAFDAAIFLASSAAARAAFFCALMITGETLVVTPAFIADITLFIELPVSGRLECSNS